MNRVKDFYKKISEQIVLFAIIIVIIIAMGIASPYFLSVRNAMNIVQYVSTYGIIAIGMTMVILTGGINLSVLWRCLSMWRQNVCCQGYPGP